MTKQRRSFTPEFKLEATSLVVDQNYSIPEACRALDEGESAMRRWVTTGSRTRWSNTRVQSAHARAETYSRAGSLC